MVHLTLRAESPNLLSDTKWSSEQMNRGCMVNPWVLFGGGSKEGVGGPGPPISFRPIRGPKGHKNVFLETGSPPPPTPHLRIWMTWTHLISRSGSGTVIYHQNYYNTSPMLSLFADMAGQRQGGIKRNTFYFSKYINSHEPLTLDIYMHIKSTFLRLTPVQKNILWVF